MMQEPTCLSEDELQNVEMAEEEVRQKNREFKIKRRDYTGYDDEEFKDGNQGVKRNILAKYDEELEGPKDSVHHHSLLPNTFLCLLYAGFPSGIGSSINESQTRGREAICSCGCQQIAPQYRLHKSVASSSTYTICWWDPSENIDISDYKQAGEIGFKKPKASWICACCMTWN